MQLRRTVAAALPGDLQAVTGAQAADESVAAVRKAVRFIPMALMAFVAVSLFVAAFLIVNTFSMLVSQRQREHGLLRAVGATSRQVFASVVGEALVVGLVASAAGFGLGVAAAFGLDRLLPALGIALPDTQIQVGSSVAVVSMVVGTTGDAARRRRARPPRRPHPAGGRDPRAVHPDAARRRASSPATGVGALAAGAALVTAGLRAGDQSGLQRLGLGALVAFVGLGLVARHLVRPTRRRRRSARGPGSSASPAGWAATTPPATLRAPS